MQPVLVVAAWLAGVCFVLLGVLRWRRRQHMRRRVQTLAIDWSGQTAQRPPKPTPTVRIRVRLLAVWGHGSVNAGLARSACSRNGLIGPA